MVGIDSPPILIGQIKQKPFKLSKHITKISNCQLTTVEDTLTLLLQYISVINDYKVSKELRKMKKMWII